MGYVSLPEGICLFFLKMTATNVVGSVLSVNGIVVMILHDIELLILGFIFWDGLLMVGCVHCSYYIYK